MNSDPYRQGLHPGEQPGRPLAEQRGGNAGRVFAFLALIGLAAVFAAWAAGLFTVQTDGALKAPEVKVEGGELPQVDVNTADVSVGTRTETVEVPTVTVTPPDKSEK